jgi:hypothetical protein
MVDRDFMHDLTTETKYDSEEYDLATSMVFAYGHLVPLRYNVSEVWRQNFNGAFIPLIVRPTICYLSEELRSPTL